MLVNLLRGSPDEAIRREVGSQSPLRLPRQQDGAVGRLIEICPEKGRLVAGDLRCAHQPLRDFRKIETRHRRVSEGRDEMDMGHLYRALANGFFVIEQCHWRQRTKS